MNLFWENVIEQTKARLKSFKTCKFNGRHHVFIKYGNTALRCKKCGLIKPLK